MKLNKEEIQLKLEALQGWSIADEKWIVKKYRFKQFLTGIQFVQNVAQHAESVDHHPMIAIDYKMVTLRLTSWNAGGLTTLDFESAEEYDRIYEELN